MEQNTSNVKSNFIGSAQLRKGAARHLFFSFFFHFISDLAYPPLPHLSSKGLCSRLEQCYVWKDVICVMVTSRITSRQRDCNFTVDLHIGGSIYRNYLPTPDVLPLSVWALTLFLPSSAVSSISSWC